MKSARKHSPKTRTRPGRSDGKVKREHLLQVATRLYAQNGFDRTTSKAICAAADTNMAAVNYHFGSKDALYAAVLIEAHAQLVDLDVLEAIARSDGSPLSRLRAVLSQFLIRPAGTEPPAGLRVLVREMMAPSDHAPILLRKTVLPKIRVMMGIVASVLELSVDDPAVQRAMMFVIMPCIMMVIAPRELLRKALPVVDADPEVLLNEMTSYAAVGLEALRQLNRSEGSPENPVHSP
jgi:AcrR family transcriptional regulator